MTSLVHVKAAISSIKKLEAASVPDKEKAIYLCTEVALLRQEKDRLVIQTILHPIVSFQLRSASIRYSGYETWPYHKPK